MSSASLCASAVGFGRCKSARRAISRIKHSWSRTGWRSHADSAPSTRCAAVMRPHISRRIFSSSSIEPSMTDFARQWRCGDGEVFNDSILAIFMAIRRASSRVGGCLPCGVFNLLFPSFRHHDRTSFSRLAGPRFAACRPRPCVSEAEGHQRQAGHNAPVAFPALPDTLSPATLPSF